MNEKTWAASASGPLLAECKEKRLSAERDNDFVIYGRMSKLIDQIESNQSLVEDSGFEGWCPERTGLVSLRILLWL